MTHFVPRECTFGHSEHDTKEVPMPWGPMLVYDWDTYAELEGGYCLGRDDVSRTLMNIGTWEPPDIERWTRECVRHPTAIALDIGAHIGWYTLHAASAGLGVLAVEWQPERREMLTENARLAGLSDLVAVVPEIGDLASWAYNRADNGPFILKSDVEGAEDKVVTATRPLWETRKIKAAVLEISPTFADYYPTLVRQLEGWGYRAGMFDGSTFETPWPPQFNGWFTCS